TDLSQVVFGSLAEEGRRQDRAGIPPRLCLFFLPVTSLCAPGSHFRSRGDLPRNLPMFGRHALVRQPSAPRKAARGLGQRLPASARMASASACKRRKSGSCALCLSIHFTARSNHIRALSRSPRRQCARARKNQSKLSPPARRLIAVSSSATA